ncbi:SDR family NAD(P)-dependent oxidoreductase [Brachybacterium paraconglomeratum]|uniref:SDR family NAD(P)-dependent oxidoreductase n=1 Tax=Brachybacterium paraconglomeratum TaxID=173362 RepID=UPI00387A0F00
MNLLVNSAGFGLPLAFERNDIEGEARHLRLHVEVPMRLMHAALPGMLERRSGTILNIASVSAVCPGYTHTDFHARLGLPRGEEGIPDWLWLEAPRVVEESLRDAERGKAVSVPSRRYTAIWTAARLAPSGLMARLAARGR